MIREISELPVFKYSWEDDVMSGQFLDQCVKFAKAHGPIFRYEIKDSPVHGVFLVGAEANRFVFHTNRQQFSHDKGWTPILGNLVGRGLLNMDDPDHAAHRKMWNPAFTATVMESYIPVVHRIIIETLTNWEKEPEVNVHFGSQSIAFDVAAAALAGIEEQDALDKLREIFWMLLHGIESDSHEEFMFKLNQLQSEMVPMLIGMIQERRKVDPNADDSGHDVLSQIVHARFEDGRQLEDFEILGHLNVLLLAGHETTTSLSAWILYLLATMPEHWEALRRETDSVLSDIEIGDMSVIPSSEQIRKLVQLENFIKEVGRLYPPVLQVPRVTHEDVEFKGYRIPADTYVRLELGATQRMPEYFEEPERFDPSRFAAPRKEDRATPYSLVTFGGGPRICIGINFATIEVKVLAAMVLRHFELSAPRDQEPLHYGHYNAGPKNDLRVSFAKRKV